MKSFIRNLIIFCSISLAVLIATNYYIWNTTSADFRFNAYESEYLTKKHNYLIDNFSISENDRLFFGSSKIFRQVNPTQLDSLINDGNRSFNFGHAALFPFRLFEYIHYTLDAIPSDFDGELYIELTGVQRVKGSNYTTLEIQNSIKPTHMNVYLFSKYGYDMISILKTSYINRFLFLSFLKKYTLSGVLNFTNEYEEKNFNKALILEDRGFYSLDSDSLEGVLMQRADFLNGDSIINKNHLDSLNTFNKKRTINAYSKYMISWCNALEIPTNKINFIITPRHSNSGLLFLTAVRKDLESVGFNVISLADTGQFPELYEHKYSFDRGHLNLEGSRYFNKYLSKLMLTDSSTNK